MGIPGVYAAARSCSMVLFEWNGSMRDDVGVQAVGVFVDRMPSEWVPLGG